ncbi:MarR family winged helix-turn-helix transcriptional regulator [Arthrobacter sp. CJ23]|uniref:MarR family winged helix-turn-helix transcriptional regulator n=1 Tax=Arthrobacter sp. CJ23 TaxID=2972479 RepID=UPI00215CAADE|nr:MarR family winged helix-turn-helix transcriptional regulator [Arthrobacter sp. CJ23]UVJ40488.1 MarR family winged helix-turn-helix transcriptional regulator [Arthrobacter sp. CJ23]
MSVGPSTATELVHQIFDLQRTLRCAVSAHLSKVPDIGLALQGVMRFIGDGESRAGQVAARLGVTAPVLSRHIAELEELGLVDRRPDPADGRAQLLVLTGTGAAKLREFEERRSERVRNYLSDWSEEDALEATRVLQKLTASLQDAPRAMAAGSSHTNQTA